MDTVYKNDIEQNHQAPLVSYITGTFVQQYITHVWESFERNLAIKQR